MMQQIRKIWQRLFPESIEKDMAAAMLSGFAAQVRGF